MTDMISVFVQIVRTCFAIAAGMMTDMTIGGMFDGRLADHRPAIPPASMARWQWTRTPRGTMRLGMRRDHGADWRPRWWNGVMRCESPARRPGDSIKMS